MSCTGNNFRGGGGGGGGNTKKDEHSKTARQTAIIFAPQKRKTTYYPKKERSSPERPKHPHPLKASTHSNPLYPPLSFPDSIQESRVIELRLLDKRTTLLPQTWLSGVWSPMVREGVFFINWSYTVKDWYSTQKRLVQVDTPVFFSNTLTLLY